MLYSPHALLDGRTVGYKSPTSVTKSIRIWRMYKTYPNFKTIVDNFISAIIYRIKQSD